MSKLQKGQEEVKETVQEAASGAAEAGKKESGKSAASGETERAVNVYLRQPEEQEKEEIVISLVTIIQKLKKYFLVWFLVSVLVCGLIAGLFIFTSTTSFSPVRSLVTFTYDGIEKGKFPDGSTFDHDSFLNPKIIERALDSCGKDVSLVDSVREGIYVEAQIPEKVYDQMTTYGGLVEKATSGNIAAAEKLLAVSYNPTTFTVGFNYKESGFRRSEAAEILNAMLDAYRDWFFTNFGYNEALGEALESVDYRDYDYPEAVDMFSSTLNKLKRYVNNLATDDTVRFRSTETGYTFADLRESINTLQSLDLDKLDSYISFYNITKDKDYTRVYYEFRIEALERDQKSIESQLESVQDSIAQYEKDQVTIFGGAEDVNLKSSVTSEQYDRMIRQKLTLTENLAETKQSIEYYTERLSKLRRAVIAGDKEIKQVEKDLERIEGRAKDLVRLVNETADDYYKNVSLADAYRVLLPANVEVKTTFRNGIKNGMVPIIGAGALIFVAYIAVAFIEALRDDYFKRRREQKLEQNADQEPASAE